MNVLAIGLNYRSAPVAVREQWSFSHERATEMLQGLIAAEIIEEGVSLSTCNRTEFYFVGAQVEALEQWILRSFGTGLDGDSLYQYFDQDAVCHLIRVTAGLDSMVLGEPQIFGQVKEAYQNSLAAGTAGRYLNRLFQTTFRVVKQIRTETSIGVLPTSIAFQAVRLAETIFADLKKATVLMIGSGRTAELVATHLRQKSVAQLIIANRNFARAVTLSEKMGATPIALSQVSEYLAKSDIVVSSTASELPIVGKGAVESALKIRRRRPIFMIDIAVPRDIEPEVGTLEDVYLYTVDDLEAIVADNRQAREKAASQARPLIEAAADAYAMWLRAHEMIPLIQDYRAHANELRETLVERAKHQLSQGFPPEAVVDALARRITDKLLHLPTMKLREAGTGQASVLRELIRVAIENDEAVNTN